MTQLILNIEDNSLVPLLKGILSKLNGVSVYPKTEIPVKQAESSANEVYPNEKNMIKEKRRRAIEELRTIKFDPSLIDMNDERTNYIMSK